MSSAAPNAINEILRNLPSVDELLKTDAGSEMARNNGEPHAAAASRKVIAELRELAPGLGPTSREVLLSMAIERLSMIRLLEGNSGVRRVINATGVVIHTNLGRAPLSKAAREAVLAATGYCSLEYDITTGKRGRRGARCEELITELTGAEAALVVNNCAAGAFFILSVFAGGGEVIVSRGELVEIGGDFRVPDVLGASGSKLVEVGTTNRTKAVDYEKAITADTRLLLRVHPSNYRIVGFTASATAEELVDIGRRHNVVTFEDLGSGVLRSAGGLNEPSAAQSIAAGMDIVTFSGDKLLGGPQAGIIAGRAEHIERLRSHPLYRALRVDKLTYAALEATLEAHRRGSAEAEIPVTAMLAASADQIAERVERFVDKLSGRVDEGLIIESIDGASAVGGGAAPGVEFPTKLISLRHKALSAAALELKLRTARLPVIARIADDRLLLDLRTVSPDDEDPLLNVIAAAL